MILLITVTLCKKDILHKEINEPCNEWVISLNCKRCKGFSVPLMKFSFFCFPAHLTAPDISNRSINNCSYRPVRASPSVESCRECENEAPPPPPPFFFFTFYFFFVLCLCLRYPKEHAEMMSVLSDCSFFLHCWCF